MEALRSHIQEISDSLLDKVQTKGKMEVIADFAVPLPAIVTAEMLGTPTSDYFQLKQWTEVFAEILGNFQHNPGRASQVIKSLEEMTAYFRAAIAELKVRPREGVVHSLMTAEVNGDRLTEEEVIANCIIVMAGGQETTTNLIATGLLTLFHHPDQMARLKSDSSLLPSAVEELLRFEPPVLQTACLAPADTDLGGKKISKQQAVIAVMAAANRDPERFPDPNRLDLARQDNRHLAFGWAAHFCFGAALARIEGQIAFETLLRRLPGLALDPGPLTWRNNQGLRGLEALPVTFRPV
ncbi:MAG: cytochrome P450 [Terriglobia bacterium]